MWEGTHRERQRTSSRTVFLLRRRCLRGDNKHNSFFVQLFWRNLTIFFVSRRYIYFEVYSADAIQGVTKYYAPDEGLEPATLRLKVWCSTDWANRAQAIVFLLSSDASSFEAVVHLLCYLLKTVLPGRESNPGLPRDRRGYSPLYYRGQTRMRNETSGRPSSVTPLLSPSYLVST